MATTNIGTGDGDYIADQADTTYALAEDDKLTGGEYGINAMAQVAGRTFLLDGMIDMVDRAIQVGYGSDDTTVTVGANAYLSAEEKAVMVEGDSASVTNAGILHAGAEESTSIGIYVGGDDAKVVNSGYVTGYAGITVIGDGAHVVNSGTVDSRYAMHVSAKAGETTQFVNTGLIHSSSGVGITGFESDDTVINRGRIHGDVQLGEGDDVFRSKGGHLQGNVFGSGGGDTYYVDDASIDIFENYGKGFDREKGTVSFTLATNVEEGWLLGKKNLSLTGTDKVDLLYGNNGNNKMFGGMGADYITGGKGNDRLTGGNAAHEAGDLGDYFIFKNHSGKDRVMDFQDGMDKINLGSYDGIDSFADLKGHIHQSDGNLVIDLAKGDRITINDMEKVNLSEFDFQF
jgi:Ca2+-binding RTX toxin-like protein